MQKILKQQLKRYVIRKYIMAKSAHEALKLERRHRPDDVYVDQKTNEEFVSAIGYEVEHEYED